MVLNPHSWHYEGGWESEEGEGGEEEDHALVRDPGHVGKLDEEEEGRGDGVGAGVKDEDRGSVGGPAVGELEGTEPKLTGPQSDENEGGPQEPRHVCK